MRVIRMLGLDGAHILGRAPSNKLLSQVFANVAAVIEIHQARKGLGISMLEVTTLLAQLALETSKVFSAYAVPHEVMIIVKPGQDATVGIQFTEVRFFPTPWTLFLISAFGTDGLRYEIETGANGQSWVERYGDFGIKTLRSLAEQVAQRIHKIERGHIIETGESLRVAAEEAVDTQLENRRHDLYG